MNNIFGWSFECQSNKLIPAVFNDLNDFMSSVETAADLEGIPHRQYVVGLTSITDIATVHNQIKDKLIDFIRITTNAEAVNLNQLSRKAVLPNL